MIGQQGSSPDQMHDYQTAVAKALEMNPNVELAVTVSGVSGFMQSNMGFMFTTIKDRKDRLPSMFTKQPHPSIETVANDLSGMMIMSNPGLLAFLRPQPVLQISTGATNTQQGRFSYAISGVDPAEVYQTAGKMFYTL